MKLVRKTLPFLLMAMLFAIPAFAQTGNISGKVVDTDGKPMTGVTISIDRQAINQHLEVKTDNKGQFLHAGLPTGQYKVAVLKDGKTLMTNDRVTVSFGGDAKADFDLIMPRPPATSVMKSERRLLKRKQRPKRPRYLSRRLEQLSPPRTMTRRFGCSRKLPKKIRLSM